MKAFITYSHEDNEFVNRLVEDLGSSGLNVTLDERALAPGDSLLKIFGEIGTSDFLIPVLSANSVESNWVRKELGVAIVKEIEEDTFKVIPVVKEGEQFNQLRENLSTELKEALRDKLMARFDNEPYEEAFRKLLGAFAPSPDPDEVYSKIQGPESGNPFRRVRAEYFEDVNILARSFTEPEHARYDSIVEVKPTLIEGGRGSGKTMILKSLQAQIATQRMNKQSFGETELTYFGVYCRLGRWSFETLSEGTSLLEIFGEDVAAQLFQTEFYLQLIQALIDEIQTCANEKILEIDSIHEKTISSTTIEIIRPNIDVSDKPQDFNHAKHLIRTDLRKISDYLFRKKLGENPVYGGPVLTRRELQDICCCIREYISELDNITIYFLLDEYENLLPFQKVIVNTLIKWSQAGEFSIKAVSKKTGFQDPRTLEGQEIERPDDYTHIDLDYDISDSSMRKNYKMLLIRICEKMLKNEGFKETDISKLLEKRPPLDDSIKEKVEHEIKNIVAEQEKEWDTLSEKEREEYWHRLGVGAYYRAVPVKKDFAGIDDLMLLSSGIIRYFLELCGISYYFALQDDIDVKRGNLISIKVQKDAAYTLSNYHLGEITRNISDCGPKIHQFAIDIGDIFRQKLLHHLSEPEAARIRIVDPHQLFTPDFEETGKFLGLAEMHSVLQGRSGRGGMRPKHATDVQPKEYVLNRIYAPVLQFSPRPRWSTKFTCQDIKSLFDPDKRQETKSQLIQKVTPRKQKGGKIQTTLSDHVLEGGEDA
ncbi:MAG: toll/interleukin-1 receptor domain-containing protein [Euryarchaeota archaeon]|nr:toll/interleukin-1 receptor domain-containing protein [Euryarchaeota archaeon]